MAISAVAICSRALLSLGTNSISSFDEGTTESEVASNLYPMVRDGILSSHPWSFATAESRLGRLTVEPITGYSYAYQLPQNLLRVLSAGDGYESRGLNYRIFEKRLHTNAEEVILRHIFRPDELNFPPYFDSLLIKQCAADFALPITDDATRMEKLQNVASKLFSSTKLIDSQSAPAEVVDSSSLIVVRG